MTFLIVEDHDSVFEAIQNLIIVLYPDAICVRAIDEAETLRAFGKQQPHVVIMDGRLAHESFGPRIVGILRGLGFRGIIAMHASDEPVLQLGLDAGANVGCLKATDDLENFLKVLKHIVP